MLQNEVIKKMQLLRINDIEQVPEEKRKRLLKFLQEENIEFEIFDMISIGDT